MRLRLGNSKTRGYSGYHVTWDNKEVYLRSLNEFIVACMLDAHQVPYLLEQETFVVGERTYKPDFFCYSDNTYSKITKIIEVKHQGYAEVSNTYKELFEEYFLSKGIEYEVVFRFDALKTKYCPIEQQTMWKEKTKDNSQVMLGEKNPRFGVAMAESTKKLIGKLARERFLDPAYKQNIKEKVALFWASDRARPLKEKISAQRKQEKEARRAAYDLLPDIVSFCKKCNTSVIGKIKKEFCSDHCHRAWHYANTPGYGKHSDKLAAGHKRVWNYLHKICQHYNITESVLLDNLDSYVLQAKQDEVIPKHKGLSKETLKKFNVIKEDKNGKIKSNHL